MNQDTVLITGSTRGIGLALARRFAHHGHPLVLTDAPDTDLRMIAAELARTHHVHVRVVPKDVAIDTAPQEIFNELQAAGVEIEILVNNTSVGPPGRFWETPLRGDVVMIRRNVEAVVRLSKLFLPPMVQRGHGRILNTAAIDPDPEFPLAAYQATKAFVLSFSESLSNELQDTAITVTTLCPPAADTTMSSTSKVPAVDSEEFKRSHILSTQAVARAAYNGVMRGERMVVAGTTMEEKASGRRPVTAKPRSKRKPRGEAAAD